ncbi:hypothetical protein D3C76_1728730 [compost metagenome]
MGAQGSDCFYVANVRLFGLSLQFSLTLKYGMQLCLLRLQRCNGDFMRGICLIRFGLGIG